KRTEGEQRTGATASGETAFRRGKLSILRLPLYTTYRAKLDLACIRSRIREGEGQMDTLHEFERHAEGAC
ncbi:hypothetical protein, partial [Paenibacillus thiaminolyticus]|uniref:hypothetical protein n=1 Tax=Paenibacillus thiaminolyticus TaxID=49283 RepID=UPI001C720F6B